MSIRIFAHHWTKFILACCIVQLGACSASTANLQNSNAGNNAAEQINGANPSVVTGARNEPRNGPVTDISRPTQIVVLGSGTPIPDAKRASASLVLIYQGEAYLFDVGAGAIRNATKARYRYDIPALYPSQICCVFLTHLHSDHTMDLVELAYTMWWRRRDGLLAFGPNGLAGMTRALAQFMAADVSLRTGGNQPTPNPLGYRVSATEISEGIVFEKDGLIIEAFDVNHGHVKPAYGYKITTPDKVIVISGDTAYSEILAQKAVGADILFHEVVSEAGLGGRSIFWQNYHNSAHTTSSNLAKLARSAKPAKLVLYHGLHFGAPEQKVVEEVRAIWDGEVILANDLDIF